MSKRKVQPGHAVCLFANGVQQFHVNRREKAAYRGTSFSLISGKDSRNG